MQWRENEEKRETRKKGHCLECHMTLSSHVTKDKSEMGFGGLRGTGEVDYPNCTRPICRRPDKQKGVDIFLPIYTHSVLSSA